MSLSQIRRFGLRTSDTDEGQIRSSERRRALFRAASRSTLINLEDPEKARHGGVNSDNLTLPYSDERLKMEHDDPTKKICRRGLPISVAPT